MGGVASDFTMRCATTELISGVPATGKSTFGESGSGGPPSRAALCAALSHHLGWRPRWRQATDAAAQTRFPVRAEVVHSARIWSCRNRAPRLALDLPPELFAIRINVLEPNPTQHTLGGLVVPIGERDDQINDGILPGCFEQPLHSLGCDALTSFRWHQAITDLDRAGSVRGSKESASTNYLTHCAKGDLVVSVRISSCC
jgi:hypothetical protein